MDSPVKFPSAQWLHDAVVSVVTVGLVAFASTWLANPVLSIDAGKAAWAAAVVAGGRALVALASGLLNGTASLKPHQVELEAPPPAK
jgi:hypothetical protein